MTEMTKKDKNTLFWVLNAFGFRLNRAYPLPITKDVLNQIGMTAHRLSSLVYEGEDLTEEEAKAIAKWLGIYPGFLLEAECPTELESNRTIYVTPKK